MSPLSDSELEALLNVPKSGYFDVHPLWSCSLRELSRVAFEHEYLPQAFAADVLAANQRSYEERLAATGMIASVEDPTPTVLGVLTLARTPRRWLPCDYIQFLRIRGTEWGDPIADALEIDGPLARMIERLDDKLRAYLAIKISEARSVDLKREMYGSVRISQPV